MEDGSPDIVAKYQKLAAEYSKLRAQASVLKKAVSEEQNKTHDLKESLKEKDQTTRKLEQEVECLNFRNMQLTKRVSVLQTDLEETEEKVKKSTKSKSTLPNSAPVQSEPHNIFNAELISRIEENEKLHQKVFESEVEQKKIVSDLTSKLESVQMELQVQKGSMNEAISNHENTIKKLTSERAKLELALKNHEKEMKDVKVKDDICNQELQFMKHDLGSKLEEANRILSEKVTFNDTRWPQKNNLNVPILLNQKQIQLSLLITELKSIICELVRRLSDLHSYMEQKVRISEVNSDTRAIIDKFAMFLHENTQYLKSIETAFTDFSTKIQKDSSTWLQVSSLRGINTAFSKYVRYLDKLLPYLIFSIQAEGNLKGTTPRLKDIYKNLKIVATSLIIAFRKLERYIQLLVEVGSPCRGSSYCISRTVLIRKIITSLSTLQYQFEEARKVVSSKVALDHQLPTATEASKTTDNCILSSIVSVSTSMKKMTVLLEEKLDVLKCEIPYRPRGIPSQGKFSINLCVPELRQRGLNYIALLQEDEPPSIPYELALKNKETLTTYADSRENLTQQLQACQAKLAKLELEREHWMLECQLLKTKQSRMSPLSSRENGDSSPEDEEQQSFQIFVKETVNQLVAQIQLADSKALAFQTECECLYQKLKLAEKKNDALAVSIASSENTINDLKEEQKILRKNYDDQLSTMSEHLATMNETLTKQKDEIDTLKHEGTNKNTRKNRR